MVLRQETGRLSGALRVIIGFFTKLARALYDFYIYFHVLGMILLLLLLSVLGGFMFVTLELPAENAQKNAIERTRSILLDGLQCDLKKENIQARLNLYERQFRTAVVDGVSFSNGEAVTVWNIVNAVYFCIVSYTLIGYGDLAPRTSNGRIILLMYITVSVPLSNLVLDEVSKKVENVMIWWYYAFLEICSFLLFLFNPRKSDDTANNPSRRSWHKQDQLDFDTTQCTRHGTDCVVVITQQPGARRTHDTQLGRNTHIPASYSASTHDTQLDLNKEIKGSLSAIRQGTKLDLNTNVPASYSANTHCTRRDPSTKMPAIHSSCLHGIKPDKNINVPVTHSSSVHGTKLGQNTNKPATHSASTHGTQLEALFESDSQPQKYTPLVFEMFKWKSRQEVRSSRDSDYQHASDKDAKPSEVSVAVKSIIWRRRRSLPTRMPVSRKSYRDSILLVACKILQKVLNLHYFRIRIGEFFRNKIDDLLTYFSIWMNNGSERCRECQRKTPDLERPKSGYPTLPPESNRSQNRNNSNKKNELGNVETLAAAQAIASQAEEQLGKKDLGAIEDAGAEPGLEEQRVPLVVHFFVLTVYTVIGSLVLVEATKNTAQLDFIESVWFSIIAFTTAGYGDLGPDQGTFFDFLVYIFIGWCLVNSIIRSLMLFVNEVTDGLKLSALSMQDWFTSRRARTVLKTKKLKARRNWLVLRQHLLRRTIPKKLVDESAAYKASLMAAERDFVRRAYRIYFYEVFRSRFKDELVGQARAHARGVKGFIAGKDGEDIYRHQGPGDDEIQGEWYLTWWQRVKRWCKKTYFKGERLTIRGYRWSKFHTKRLWREFTQSPQYQKHIANKVKLGQLDEEPRKSGKRHRFQSKYH